MPTLTTDPLAVMASLRLEDGRPWIDVAEQFQIDDARAILAPGADDPRLHWLGRPKGGSKSTDLGGVAIAWLLTMARPLDEGYALASDGDQAKRLLARAAGLIARTPGLADHLEVQSWSIVHRRTGAKVVALAADAAGAEGTVSPLYLVDELPQWADTQTARALWDAAYSSIPKGSTLPGGLRFVVIGHAGVEGSWQHRLFEQFAASQLWRVNDVAGPLPWLDPVLLEDQRATLTDPQYARRVLNRWSSAEEAITTADELRRCVTLSGPQPPQQGTRYVIGVDLGLKSDRTVAAVVHVESTMGAGVGEPLEGEFARHAALALSRGTITQAEYQARMAKTDGGLEGARVVLDRMETWQGSKRAPVQLADVQAWLWQAATSYGNAEVVIDPWQAIGLAQSLRKQGVSIDEFTFSQQSVGRLASTLHRLLRDGLLALPDDEDLLDELAHVRLVERSPGVVRMDHAHGRHDDRAIALALAATRALERPPPAPLTEHSYTNLSLQGTR